MASTPKPVTVTDADAAKRRMRSPAYPYISLENAIKRARAFYEKEGRNSAPVGVASTHWGYEAKSSGGTQTAAALISFGLLQDEGTADKRRLKLTASALKILLDSRVESPERDELIKQAALAPRIHKQLWAKWGVEISDENLRHALVLDWEPPFNENSVDGFIKEYRDTIRFAKLSKSDTLSLEDDSSEGASGGLYVPKVGDYVQWESQGAFQFKEPVRVRAISTDGTHAFVDGSSTGLPISQLQRADAPATPVPQAQIQRSALLSNTPVQEDVYSLPEGRVVVQWPAALSAESIDEVKSYLKLLERKIERSKAKDSNEQPTA